MQTNTINQVLTLDKISKIAPSVFQTSAKDTLSKKYNFIPTVELVKEMERSGWLPVKAVESKTRIEGKNGYQKHMVRFRNFDENAGGKLEVGDSFIELVLTNSHDGLSSFIFNLGLFRLACSNGMVVPESTFGAARIRHNSYDATNVIDICAQTIEEAPQIIGNVNEMKAIELTIPEQEAFANSAKLLRFDNPEDVSTDSLLRAKRISDKGDNLWKTFNRVQENMEKGGVMYRNYNKDGQFTGTRHSREVKSIDGGIKLNQALWQLAEEMKRLKTGSIMATVN